MKKNKECHFDHIKESAQSTMPFDRGIIESICIDTQVYDLDRKSYLGRPWLTILFDDYSSNVLAI